MSFILDALKKAERERKLGNVPSIDATLGGLTGPTRGSRWPTIIAAGLIANATVLGALYAYWQYRPESPPNLDHSMAEVTSPPFQEKTAPPPAVEPPEPPRRPSQSAITNAADSSVEVAASAPGRSTPTAKLLENQQSIELSGASEASMATGTTEPPLLENLPAAFRINVPKLELSVHVYSDNPSQRFIFVNNRRYGEGQDTEEGAHVERIQSNGIVLSFQGQQFFVPGRW